MTHKELVKMCKDCWQVYDLTLYCRYRKNMPNIKPEVKQAKLIVKSGKKTTFGGK